MKKRVSLLCGFFLWFSLAVEAKTLTLLPNSQKIQNEELTPQVKKSGIYAEGWSLWAWNDKRWTIQIAFFVTRMHPFVGILCGAQITVKTPEGKIYHHFSEVKEKELRWRKKGIHIRIRKNYWYGDQEKGKLRFAFPQFNVRLEYKRLLEGFRLFDGSFEYNQQRFEAIPFAPKMRVKGSIQLGKQKIPFEGLGFADRSKQGAPHKIAKRWLAARLYDSKHSIFLTHWKPYQGKPSQELTDLHIAQEGKWLPMDRGYRVQWKVLSSEKDPKTGYKVPTHFLIQGRLQNQKLFFLRVQTQKQFHRLNVLAHVPAVLRFFIQKWITNPYVYRYETRMSLSFEKDKTAFFPVLGVLETSFLH